MTRQHSHLGPVFFQCPQLDSSSQKIQQQFNLYQSLRTCRSKGKRFSFNNIIVEPTFMIQFWHIQMQKQLFSASNLDPYRVRPSDPRTFEG